MKKNIGILFSSSRKMGVFQYGLSIAEGLINFCPDFDYTVLYFEKESPEEFLKLTTLENVTFVSLSAEGNSWPGKIKFLLNCFLGKPVFTTNKKNKEIMGKLRLDLLIIPFQLMFGFEHKVPYIMSVPDIMYKYYPQFPEYSFKNRIISDIIFHYSTKFSTLNIVDSEGGKADLEKFFHVPSEKIQPIPYLPAGYVFSHKDMTLTQAKSILEKYHVPEKFIFYPAQFWEHKNHLRLIEAVKIVEERYGQKIPLVLVGNDKANSENYQKIMALASQLGVADRIFHLGYVSDEEIVALYKIATALVFASLGGPTNIPLVEAMFLGTPVICPNLFSMPEQVGDAGVLFDPFSPSDMAEKIHSVWQNETLRTHMIEAGYRQVKDFTFERYADLWISAVKTALAKITK